MLSFVSTENILHLLQDRRIFRISSFLVLRIMKKGAQNFTHTSHKIYSNIDAVKYYT